MTPGRSPAARGLRRSRGPGGSDRGGHRALARPLAAPCRAVADRAARFSLAECVCGCRRESERSRGRGDRGGEPGRLACGSVPLTRDPELDGGSERSPNDTSATSPLASPAEQPAASPSGSQRPRARRQPRSPATSSIDPRPVPRRIGRPSATPLMKATLDRELDALRAKLGIPGMSAAIQFADGTSGRAPRASPMSPAGAPSPQTRRSPSVASRRRSLRRSSSRSPARTGSISTLRS